MRGLLLAVLVAAATCPGAAQELPAFRFHHLHLNDDRPPFLLEFYERLFDPALTSRVVEGESSGLRSGPMLLLFGKGASDASEPHRPLALRVGRRLARGDLPRACAP